MNKKVLHFDSIYAGEYAIQELVKNDNNSSAHFKYSHHPPKGYELVVITYNPNHKTSFFLHSLYGETQKKALENMYDHIFVKIWILKLCLQVFTLVHCFS